MNRRAFVGLLCRGATAVAGCSTPGRVRNSGEQGQAIEDQQFDLVDPKAGFGGNDSAFGGQSQSRVDVRFDATADRVVVLGHVNSGSRSCRETVLDSARYDEESDSLTVVILDRFDGSTLCTLEKAIVPYGARVTFGSSLPDRTVVKHRREGVGIVYSETFTAG